MTTLSFLLLKLNPRCPQAHPIPKYLRENDSISYLDLSNSQVKSLQITSLATLFLLFLTRTANSVLHALYGQFRVVSYSAATNFVLEVCCIDSLAEVFKHLLNVRSIFCRNYKVIGLVHLRELLDLTISHYSFGF